MTENNNAFISPIAQWKWQE